MSSTDRDCVVCVFHEVAGFERAVDGLLKAGFDASSISILGDHEAIVDHFGRVPRPAEMTDTPDTPREALDTEVALHKAIDFIAGTLAIIGEVGAAAAAYAVGGPVGVAAGSADMTDATVDNVLSSYVDDNYRDRFDQSVRDGGMICWVQVRDDSAAVTASRILASAGGSQIHRTSL